jgi:tricorn protease
MPCLMKSYCMYPDIFGENVIFVSDDDLWLFDMRTEAVRKLASGVGIVTYPRFSPDGKKIVFRAVRYSSQPSAELYAIPSAGGEAKRVTYFGSMLTTIAGWSKEGRLIVSSDFGKPFMRYPELFEFDLEIGSYRKMNIGPATAVEFGAAGTVLARNSADLPQWKRYKGGARGKFWKDNRGNGKFRKFLELDSNLTSPMWIGERLYFISDHEGTGNIYSVDAEGGDLTRHTSYNEFFARNARSDGRRIVYQCGGELFVFDPLSGKSEKIEMDIPSTRIQTKERFVETKEFVEECSMDSEAKNLVIVARGKLLTMQNWDGPVLQMGKRDGVRYRLGRFLKSGFVVAVSDEGGEERIEVFGRNGIRKKIIKVDSSVMALQPSPAGNLFAYSTNRYQLIVSDITGKKKLIDSSAWGPIDDFAWSPDGRFIAYSIPQGHNASNLRIAETDSGKKVNVTQPSANDFSPAFDPEGRYLFFISDRELDPTYDRIMFDLGFQKTSRPFAVSLRRELPSPFIAPPVKDKKTDEKVKNLRIDFESIETRVEAFPVVSADYAKIRALKGKVFFLSFPVEGSKKYWLYSSEKRKGKIESFDLSTGEVDTFAENVSDFEISDDRSHFLLQYDRDIRVCETEKKVEGTDDRKPGRKSGFIDLGRMKIRVNPLMEWEQMLRETWRLMRDNYWREDMHGVDWDSIYSRYRALLPRISTRFELSDVIREMQGEMGTSHAYEIGGEYRTDTSYGIGSLGAEFELKNGKYIVSDIYVGDPANDGEKSPLLSPGVDARKGDALISVDGVELAPDRPPQSILENRAGDVVSIVLERGGRRREFTVRALRNEKRLTYRTWVERNRNYVHQRTDGKVGYLHIPDMGPNGFAEFHRIYRLEIEREALIVDVRYNSGGHVSALLLEKLARKRIGYDRPRRGMPVPYPPDSVKGPMVAITNENAGSDGDIFSHGFKLFNLGPLIGTRTWGGVIGINPRLRLVDGTTVTQPQYAFWFKDVGWGVENYGTDPTIEVEIAPQDYRAGVDTQLERALEEIRTLMDRKEGILQAPEIEDLKPTASG